MLGGNDAMFLQRRRRTLGILITGFLTIALFVGCGEDETSTLPVEEVAAGWSSFQNGQFDNAISSFQSAMGQAEAN